MLDKIKTDSRSWILVKSKFDVGYWMMKRTVSSKQKPMTKPVEDPPPILPTAYCILLTAYCIYHTSFQAHKPASSFAEPDDGY